jgi:hypothetical protein
MDAGVDSRVAHEHGERAQRDGAVRLCLGDAGREREPTTRVHGRRIL